MKKTCTITFHAADNYGAFFQAYALQTFLTEEVGVENDIINFVSDHMKEHYKVFKKNNCIKSIVRNLIVLPYAKGINRRRKAFVDDRNKYLKLTKEISTEDEYFELIKKYDLGIAGSDQIWNLHSEDFTPLFFLPGLKEKISFAASTGNNVDKTKKKEYKEYLKDFKKVSIREKNVALFFNEMQLKSGATEVCIDPTFLLSSEDYKKLTSDQPHIKEKYILFYSINNNDEAMKLASDCAKKMGMKIYAVYSRVTSIKAKKYGMKIYEQAGPSDFMNLLKHAELVLTNSFHGTALSIIMNKEFLRIGLSVDGIMKRDERIDSILEFCGLESRTITSEADFDKVKKFDWNIVSKNIAPQIKHAKDYLIANVKHSGDMSRLK